tara:strand:+ start:2515 stop:3522 length:1008 start_codon:yes stop_codon:yes gene_type:complete
MINIKKLNVQEKVKLFKDLYKDLSGKGIGGDTELAHINKFESTLLRSVGGQGSINLTTGLKQYFGGGGGNSGGTSTTIAREAPGVEARKLALYDEAAKLAQNKINLPGIQVAPISGLEQAGIAQAGQTGVGAGTVTQGIGSLQAGMQNPNIGQFLNPYQSYVTNEIGRQGQIQQNQLNASAIDAGAFGGGRQGVQQAELQNRTLQAMGQAQAQGFQTALGAAQTQRQQQLAGGQALGQLGAQQQQMSLADINAQMQAGAVQRGIGQQGLEAQRQTELQRLYEPYQRVEFMKGIMTNLPTTQSSITATTAPGANPLSQAVGTGLAGYSAYNMMQPR